jgi:FdhE protein
MTANAIGAVSDPDFVRLPDANSIFGKRAQRLSALAQASAIGPYLAFLSEIVGVQQSAHVMLPSLHPTSRRARTGFPIISADALRDDAELGETLARFAEISYVPSAPPEAEQARRRVCAMPSSERLALSLAIFEAAYPVEDLGESLYVAAALQLHLTRLASTLDEVSIQPVEDGVCPVCGAGPVASIVVGWAKAARARYCCCSFCSTMWHVVRIKCTACGATGGIEYFSLQGGDGDVAIETCAACSTYIKHLHQHRSEQLEPFADDLSSFPLDTLAAARQLHRSTTNPLMPIRMP